LSGSAAKAGRFLFKQEPKAYELTVLPWFALDQTHDTDIVRKRVDLKVSGGHLGTGSNLLDCAERSSPKPLSGAPKARGLTAKARIERS